MDIVTVTLNPCVDKTFAVDRVVPDRKLTASEVHQYPGGGGLNVARAVAKLGDNTMALWSCGGTTGQRLAELLDHENISHSPVSIQENVRENLIVTDRSSNQQYRFGMQGPTLSDSERRLWQKCLREHAASARYVIFSGSLPGTVPASWYRELIRDLPTGTRVIVDTKQEALRAALSANVYLIKPNAYELEQIAERELRDDSQIIKAGQALIQLGQTEVVLVSLGRGGALLVTEESSLRIAAPAVPMRSKVGAGDSMVGGLVSALAQRRPIDEAARFAVAAGAAAVMTEGTELCRREDAEHLFTRIYSQEVAG